MGSSFCSPVLPSATTKLARQVLVWILLHWNNLWALPQPPSSLSVSQGCVLLTLQSRGPPVSWTCVHLSQLPRLASCCRACVHLFQLPLTALCGMGFMCACFISLHALFFVGVIFHSFSCAKRGLCVLLKFACLPSIGHPNPAFAPVFAGYQVRPLCRTSQGLSSPHPATWARPLCCKGCGLAGFVCHTTLGSQSLPSVWVHSP